MNTSIIRLAIAENHPLLRDAVINLLETNERLQVVLSAANGFELLSRFETLHLLPDIVLLDIDMPVMDGYHTAKEIRNRYPNVKSIAFSFYNSEYNIIKMINSGAVAYLAKGAVSFEEMLVTIDAVYSNGYYYSQLLPDELFEKAKGSPMPDFTSNELRFLALCCEGLSDKEIADRMFISVRSVEYYFKSVSSKLKISKRIGIVAYVLKAGIIPWQ